MELDMSQMQALHLGRHGRDHAAGGPATTRRVGPGLVLLDSPGAHLLGQRTLQMALGMEASGGSEDNKEKQNNTIWATFIWCL